MIKGKKPRQPNEPLHDAVRERFAQKLAAGYTQTAAWRETHPKTKACDKTICVKATYYSDNRRDSIIYAAKAFVF